jgi:hypothetical protein
LRDAGRLCFFTSSLFCPWVCSLRIISSRIVGPTTIHTRARAHRESLAAARGQLTTACLGTYRGDNNANRRA